MKKIIMLCLIALITGTTFAQKGFEKSVEFGTSVGVGDLSNTTFGVYMINGYRFNEHLFTGVGVGVGYSNALNAANIEDGDTTDYRTAAYMIPVFVNIKFNLSTGSISPFIQMNAGYTYDANQYLKDAPGFMFEPSLGLDFKMNNNNSMYFLFGFNLQHSEYSYSKDLDSSDWDIVTKSEMLKSISVRIGIKF